jgi:pyruvate dehydrogenase E2 component (dihydrolipoamide acetyltransferase)
VSQRGDRLCKVTLTRLVEVLPFRVKHASQYPSLTSESSGTFTISNLGMFGVSQFGAILPPGTGAILAVGGAAPVVEV